MQCCGFSITCILRFASRSHVFHPKDKVSCSLVRSFRSSEHEPITNQAPPQTDTKSDGLQPASDGLQPKNNGLQPRAKGTFNFNPFLGIPVRSFARSGVMNMSHSPIRPLHKQPQRAMASNLLAIASNLKTMASNLYIEQKELSTSTPF